MVGGFSSLPITFNSIIFQLWATRSISAGERRIDKRKVNHENFFPYDKLLHYVCYLFCRSTSWATSRIQRKGREISGNSSFATVLTGACQRNGRRQHVRHLSGETAQCGLLVWTRHMRRLCFFPGGLSYVQKTHLTEDTTVQLTGEGYLRVLVSRMRSLVPWRYCPICRNSA